MWRLAGGMVATGLPAGLFLAPALMITYVYSSVLAFLVIFHIVFSYADYSSCPVGTRAEREAGDVQWMGIGE